MTDFGARFLTVPDLFPARNAGDARGQESLHLSIAGEPFTIHGLSQEQLQGLAPRHVAAATGSEANDPTRLHVYKAAPTDFQEIDLAGKLYEIDLDYNERSVRCAAPGLMARLDWREGDGHVRLEGALWTPHPTGDPFLDAFENTLRLLAAYRLLETGGVLLHSAAVAGLDGRCRVMVGRSGAGKTTISQLALDAGRTVISDDLNALSPGPEGELRVGALPFAGTLGGESVGLFPLDAIYRLRQGPQVAIEHLPAGQALAALLACAPFVNHDRYRAQALENRLTEIASENGAFTLTFPREGPVWEHLDPVVSS